MSIKNLLVIGILVFGGIVPHSLQGVSVPQENESASEKGLKNASYSWGDILGMNNTYVNYRRSNIVARKSNVRTIRNIPRRTVQRTTPTLTAQVAPSPRVSTYHPAVDQNDIEQKHKEIASELLYSMPQKCQDTLKNFHVRYDNPEKRGLAGKNTIILTGNVSDQEFRALMIHELGHVFDLNENRSCLAGSPAAGSSEFKDGNDLIFRDDPSLSFYRISWASEKTKLADSSENDFVTGYAAWDVFEDFAESFAYFVLHNETFRERAKYNSELAKKYDWFVQNLFPNGVAVATSEHTWTGKIPWDATKLPYVWTE